jgi:hypothetical protein
MWQMEANKLTFARYQVLTAKNIKITTFWDMAPCAMYCLQHPTSNLNFFQLTHWDDKGMPVTWLCGWKRFFGAQCLTCSHATGGVRTIKSSNEMYECVNSFIAPVM